jgi:hypothetical protein
VKAAARRGRGGRRARARASATVGRSTRRPCVVGCGGRERGKGKGKGVSGAAARSAQPLYDDADGEE